MEPGELVDSNSPGVRMGLNSGDIGGSGDWTILSIEEVREECHVVVGEVLIRKCWLWCLAEGGIVWEMKRTIHFDWWLC